MFKNSLLLAGLCTAPLVISGCSAGNDGPKLVVLVSIDTLRSDHLSCYGYARKTSEHLDRFAEEDAVLFERSYTNAPWTLPAHMSMFTGVYPDEHGMLGVTSMAQLSTGIPTIAEYFASEGFATGAFTDGGYVDAQYGFGRGFEQYHPRQGDGGFASYSEQARTWITEHANQDAFLFLHSYEVHGPYQPNEPYRSRFVGEPHDRTPPKRSLFMPSLSRHAKYLDLEEFATIGDVIDAYDGGIAEADAELGQIFDHIKSTGLWENATILVTSDHGEAFLDRDIHLGHSVFGELSTLKVPFLLKLPASEHAGRRIGNAVELVDVLPTLLDGAGIEPLRDTAGMSVIDGLETGRWPKDYGFGYTDETSFHYLLKDDRLYQEAPLKPWMSFCNLFAAVPAVGREFNREDIFSTFSLIHDQARLLGAEDESFVSSDPADLRPYSELVEELLAASLESRLPPDPREGDANEHTELLEALGYFGDGAGDPSTATEEIPPLWHLLDKAVAVDWDVLYESDEALWELTRIVKRRIPVGSLDEMRAKIEAAVDLLVRVIEDRPDQERHAAWRLRVLSGISYYLEDQVAPR